MGEGEGEGVCATPRADAIGKAVKRARGPLRAASRPRQAHLPNHHTHSTSAAGWRPTPAVPTATGWLHQSALPTPAAVETALQQRQPRAPETALSDAATKGSRVPGPQGPRATAPQDLPDAPRCRVAGAEHARATTPRCCCCIATGAGGRPTRGDAGAGLGSSEEAQCAIANQLGEWLVGAMHAASAGPCWSSRLDGDPSRSRKSQAPSPSWTR